MSNSEWESAAPPKPRRQKKGDWVVMGGKPGESAYCSRCGEGLTLNMPQRMEVWLAATKAFVRAHGNCPPGKNFEKPTKTPQEWAKSRDTGISSATIFAAITGDNIYDHFDVPYDADDFGRCYRLLNLFPAWRDKLPKVITVAPKWKPFVENWDELTRLYEEELPSGRCSILYEKLQKLRERGTDASS